MTHLHFTLKTEEIQNLIDQCMCQEFLGLVFVSIYSALYFCTAILATALSLAGLEQFVGF